MPRKAVGISEISPALPIRMFVAALSLALALAVISGAAARDRDDRVWPVKGKLLGKDGKKSRDASGIACATAQDFPRSCLVIDDNVQQAQFVTVKDGKIIAGGTIRLIDNTYKRKALELDGEGVAYVDGFYYVIGSHGHPRDSDHELDPKKHAATQPVARSSVSVPTVTAPLPRSSVQES